RDFSGNLRRTLRFFARSLAVSALLCLLAETQGQCLKKISICLLFSPSSPVFYSSRSLRPRSAGFEKVAVLNEKSHSICEKERRDNLTENGLSECQEKSAMSKL